MYKYKTSKIEYTVYPIAGTSLRSTDSKRGSFHADVVCTKLDSDYPNNQKMMRKRFYVDCNGNVYTTAKSNKVAFSLK